MEPYAWIAQGRRDLLAAQGKSNSQVEKANEALRHDKFTVPKGIYGLSEVEKAKREALRKGIPYVPEPTKELRLPPPDRKSKKEREEERKKRAQAKKADDDDVIFVGETRSSSKRLREKTAGMEGAPAAKRSNTSANGFQPIGAFYRQPPAAWQQGQPLQSAPVQHENTSQHPAALPFPAPNQHSSPAQSSIGAVGPSRMAQHPSQVTSVMGPKPAALPLGPGSASISPPTSEERQYYQDHLEAVTKKKFQELLTSYQKPGLRDVNGQILDPVVHRNLVDEAKRQVSPLDTEEYLLRFVECIRRDGQQACKLVTHFMQLEKNQLCSIKMASRPDASVPLSPETMCAISSEAKQKMSDQMNQMIQQAFAAQISQHQGPRESNGDVPEQVVGQYRRRAKYHVFAQLGARYQSLERGAALPQQRPDSAPQQQDLQQRGSVEQVSFQQSVQQPLVQQQLPAAPVLPGQTQAQQPPVQRQFPPAPVSPQHPQVQQPSVRREVTATPVLSPQPQVQRQAPATQPTGLSDAYRKMAQKQKAIYEQKIEMDITSTERNRQKRPAIAIQNVEEPAAKRARKGEKKSKAKKQAQKELVELAMEADAKGEPRMTKDEADEYVRQQVEAAEARAEARAEVAEARALAASLQPKKVREPKVQEEQGVEEMGEEDESWIRMIAAQGDADEEFDDEEAPQRRVDQANDELRKNAEEALPRVDGLAGITPEDQKAFIINHITEAKVMALLKANYITEPKVMALLKDGKHRAPEPARSPTEQEKANAEIAADEDDESFTVLGSDPKTSEARELFIWNHIAIEIATSIIQAAEKSKKAAMEAEKQRLAEEKKAKDKLKKAEYQRKWREEQKKKKQAAKEAEEAEELERQLEDAFEEDEAEELEQLLEEAFEQDEVVEEEQDLFGEQEDPYESCESDEDSDSEPPRIAAPAPFTPQQSAFTTASPESSPELVSSPNTTPSSTPEKVQDDEEEDSDSQYDSESDEEPETPKKAERRLKIEQARADIAMFEVDIADAIAKRDSVDNAILKTRFANKVEMMQKEKAEKEALIKELKAEDEL